MSDTSLATRPEIIIPKDRRKKKQKQAISPKEMERAQGYVPDEPTQMTSDGEPLVPLPVETAAPAPAAQSNMRPPEMTPEEQALMQDAQYGAPSLDYVPLAGSQPAVAPAPIDGLADDAPGDDRVDNALMKRAKDIEKQHALEWLLGEVPGASIGAMTGALIGIEDRADAERAKPGLEADAFRTEVRKGVAKTGEAMGAVAADAAGGVVEAPRQAVAGAIEAIKAIDGLAATTGHTLAEWTSGKALQEPERITGSIPTPGKARTVTGNLVRGVSQFLTGFALGGAGLKAAGVAEAAGPGVMAAAKGAISDFAFFEGQEANLAALIQEQPALANPVTAFLATNPDDSEGVNRLKRALEGLGMGGVTQAFVPALAAIRASRATPADAGAVAKNAAAAMRAEDAPTTQARDLLLLGSPDAPLTARAGDPAAAKLTAAGKETESGVADDVTAKALTDKGLTPLGNGEVYVNFAKIEAPEDIQRVIQDMSTAFKPDIDDARRGVRTHAETKEAAGDIDAFDTIMQRRKGQPLNAEESFAVRQLWTGAADKLQEVARLAAANPSTENLFQFRKMMATFHAIQKEVLGARAETARALNAWKIPAGGSKQQMAAIEAAMNNFGGEATSAELAKKIAGLNDRAALGEFVEKTTYAKSRDAVQEYWINSILSGPQTHVVNMISNASVAGLIMVEHAVAARLGRLLGGENVVEIGEASAQMHGMISGFKDALRNAGKTLKTGETGYGTNKIEMPGDRAFSSTAWNLRSDSWGGRAVDALGAAVNVPGRLLQTEDEFFKTIGYRMSLHGQAYRQVQKEIAAGSLPREEAKNRLAELVAHPTEDMSLEAASAAAYQTFTTEPGPILRHLNSIRGKAPLTKFMIPFLNTPTNIFKFTAERTPLAPLTARYKAAIAKGGPEADLARTKLALGTMLIMTAIDLRLNGMTTDSGPKSAAERDNQRRQGFQPNSVKIGDKYFAFNRLDPVGSLLGMGAELGGYLANSGEMDDEEIDNYTRAVAAAIFAVSETATSKTYLTGVSDVLEAVNDPDRYGQGYIQRFAGGFVPKIVKDAARAGDPVQRYANGVIEEMMAGLPGLRDNLPPRRDLWGREVKYESGMGAAFDAMSPIYGSQYKPEPIDAEMMKNGAFLGMPAKKFSIDGQEINLRDRLDAYSRLLELSGGTRPSAMGDAGAGLAKKYGDGTLLETLNAIVSGKHPLSADYAGLTDPEDRHNFIERVSTAYRKAAKEVIVGEFPDLLE